jgi:hypothetical protein
MKKTWLMVTIVVLSISLFGCGIDTDKSTATELQGTVHKQQKEQHNPPLEVMKTINGIEYSLSISGNQFDLDGEIEVNGTVKNVSDHPIDYIGYDGCDRGIHVFIPIPTYQSYFLEKDWDQKEAKGCTMAIEHYTLEPGETLNESKVFIPSMRMGNLRGMDIPTGDYKAKLIFQRGELDSKEEYDQGIELALHIDGAKNILTKQEAEDIGRNNEELQQWLSKRIGSVVTKEKNGNYYVMELGRWQKATKQYYEQLDDYTPEYWIGFKDYEWIMTYIDKAQGPPHRFEIKIDAKSGNISEINRYEK